MKTLFITIISGVIIIIMGSSPTVESANNNVLNYDSAYKAKMRYLNSVSENILLQQRVISMDTINTKK